MNRELLMLAQVYNPEKHNIAGWMASEKKDGQRFWWDGGISRGRPTVEVPWANLDRKVKPVSTGLWSRYGNVIVAPNVWLDELPVNLMLDGELWNRDLQLIRTIVSTDVPDRSKWQDVKALIIDSPGLEVFAPGTINNPNYNKFINTSTCVNYLRERVKAGHPEFELETSKMFTRSYQYLLDTIVQTDNLQVLEQVKLHVNPIKAKDQAYEMLNGIVEAGGEGLMLRHYGSFWAPKRVTTLLKMKPMLDSEAKVIGWTDGQKRLDGKMGALVVNWGNVTFNIGTGFLDCERDALLYPLGTMINFKYVSLTKDGVPREARFSHIRTAE